MTEPNQMNTTHITFILCEGGNSHTPQHTDLPTKKTNTHTTWRHHAKTEDKTWTEWTQLKARQALAGIATNKNCDKLLQSELIVTDIGPAQRTEPDQMPFHRPDSDDRIRPDERFNWTRMDVHVYFHFSFQPRDKQHNAQHRQDSYIVPLNYFALAAPRLIHT